MNLAGSVHLNKTGITIFTIGFLFLIYYMFIRDDTIPEKRLDAINLKELLSTSILAAKAGGLEVMKYKNTDDVRSKGKTKEGANDSVTVADLKSHCMMVETLKKFAVSVNVISEETVARCDQFKDKQLNIHNADVKDLIDVYVRSEDVTVWIDPLDATQEFTENLLQYVTTMVCVAVKNKPLIGVIYQPLLNEYYWAWVGVGHSKNIIKNEHTDKLKIIISRSHRGNDVEDMIKNSHLKNFEITPAGGSGFKVLELVKGRADLYVHLTAIKKWDICSGNAILNRLGGKMVDLKGHEIDYSFQSEHVHESGIVAALKNADVYLKNLVTNNELNV